MKSEELQGVNGGGIFDPSVIWFNMKHALRNAARVAGFIKGVSDGFSEGYSNHSY